MFKRNLFIILSLFSATASHATSTSVTIPELKSGFEYNLAISFMKPAASNLNYVIYNKGKPLQSPTWTEKELQPSFTPGFELGVRYNFVNSIGSYTKLYWTHLNSHTHATTDADNTNYFLGPDYEIGPTGIPIRHADGTATFLYDVVNLDFAQYGNFGRHFYLRFFGGLSTAFLREQVTATYSGNTVGTYAGPFSTKQTVQSKFFGVGPRVGIGSDYNFNSGISLLGELATSGLIGAIHSKTSYISSAQQLLVTYGQKQNYQTIADKHVYQVIPALDLKLAAKFTHTFRNSGLLSLSLGWQGAVYVNAISQYLPQSLVPGSPLETGGIFVETMSHKLSNYSVQGPFLNFSYVF